MLLLNFLPIYTVKVTKKTTPDAIDNEWYDLLFGSDYIYSDFQGFDGDKTLFTSPNFTPNNNRRHDKNRNELSYVQQKTATDKNVPEGFSMNNWNKGNSEVMSEFPFIGTPRFKVKIPDDGDQLYFLKIFLNEETIASLTLQTNKHAADFIQANSQKLREHSRFFKWDKMR